jgi:hypothetical protein
MVSFEEGAEPWEAYECPGIQSEATLHLVLRLRGGNEDLVDVTRTDTIQKLMWKEELPNGSKRKKAFRMWASVPAPSANRQAKWSSAKLDFTTSTSFKMIIIIVQSVIVREANQKPGFHNCMWRISAVRENTQDFIFQKPWARVGNS